MTIDFTTVVNTLLALAAAAVTAAIPILVPYILKRLKIANSTDLAQTIDAAAIAGAGQAYNYALAHEGGLARLDVKNAAIAAGAQHVATSVPDALAKLGITPAAIEAMVTARLGSLLAHDPSITAGTPPQVPATVVPSAAPIAAASPPPIVSTTT